MELNDFPEWLVIAHVKEVGGDPDKGVPEMKSTLGKQVLMNILAEI